MERGEERTGVIDATAAEESTLDTPRDVVANVVDMLDSGRQKIWWCLRQRWIGQAEDKQSLEAMSKFEGSWERNGEEERHKLRTKPNLEQERKSPQGLKDHGKLEHCLHTRNL